MVFPKTLCDDISSSDHGATDKAFFSFAPSLPLSLFSNSNNWFGVNSLRGPHGLASFFLAMVWTTVIRRQDSREDVSIDRDNNIHARRCES
ncbi:hypothetical protein AVEN_231779-1 [Araneus ventricosus]|uniref:Uncharacterized protein n=1 Tax=Araneus ventricosus TaxID=182803 RepID=A0A4Y2NEQ1_ARAVE|nr:hypothetical protein AVEN_231779-1 [Araneus ventricosus]